MPGTLPVKKWVEAAAIKVRGKIYSGPFIHACLYEDAKKETGLSRSILCLESEEGYLLNTGEFVDRHEAYELAMSNGQTSEEYASYTESKELHFPDLFEL